MKHLVIADFGTYLGIRHNLLSIRNGEDTQTYPLTRLRTISIAKSGVSVSSDLIEQCSIRGIKLFFLNFKGVPHTFLSSTSQHATVQVRIAQQEYCSGKIPSAAIEVVTGKVTNQRHVLSYFNKYRHSQILISAIEQIKDIQSRITHNIKSKEVLLGMEGSAARIYFEALADSMLMPSTFTSRQGRGSREITNSMLNMGYAVLGNYVMNSIINAGLEPYLGFLHTKRPGKPSLMLDLMEEYRAWVVDREVIKLKSQAEGKDYLSQDIKKKLIIAIQNTMEKKYLYNKKRVRLEHIIQRQIYRMSGHFQNNSKYKSYKFKW